MRADICGASHRGKVRDHNEDNIYVDGMFRGDLSTDNIMIRGRRSEGPHTLAVFDGLGGEACGEQASLLAALGLRAVEERGIAGAAEAYISTAHRTIKMEAERNNAFNMGTTAAVVHIDGESARIFNVGDSRVYLFRGDSLMRMSKDHNVTQSLIDSGLMNETDGFRSRYSSELTQYIGMFTDEERVPAAYKTETGLETGDILVLCSDGLSGELRDGEIAEMLGILRGESAESIAVRLLNRAVDGRARDNISVIVCVIG